ncbi:MAG: GatB/YqeY domain-containing protein [Myxococcales bacterium]|nr:GatB/YqeY domain-containing protein [Myxococcales bacterium]
MLIDAIKSQITVAMKARDTLAKDILRVALGEIQTAEARAGGPVPDEEAQRILKKLVKSNEETMAIAKDPDTQAKLKRENEILGGLLPKALSVDDIVAALDPVADAIKAAKADGPAMGLAMKHLKQAGAPVEAPDVTAAVKAIRGS